jgi:predicted MFS family arabinose efflux permease
VGFKPSILIMMLGLGSVWLCSLMLLKANLGRSVQKPKLRQLLSKSSVINHLSAARLFLFCARDVWFVVALPVYLAQQLNWAYWQVSAFLAVWIIGYGLVQMLAPLITRKVVNNASPNGFQLAHKISFKWQITLMFVPLALAMGLYFEWQSDAILIIGLGMFGIVFAVNSCLHSYLIVALSKSSSVAMDVGFYYMANAVGRLLGTLLSGWVFIQFGFISCLLISAALVLCATYFTFMLAHRH